ncbi:hypothetical protein RHGRI_038067 [Rhododendron griersonianum]|uniref:Uncharacterized protein n=1 Tax=Rhododendron griersonianum TaxID=479676 RepID=A0AAV6HXQ9_9ERIC|nr:hypothetical protein RHGRI_038067 [Rhododendron griersonianum]
MEPSAIHTSTRRSLSYERILAIFLGLIAVLSPLYIDRRPKIEPEFDEEPIHYIYSHLLPLLLLVLVLTITLLAYLEESFTSVKLLLLLLMREAQAYGGVEFLLPVPSGDPKKTEHLLSLEGAKERLHLFKANLLEEGSFDAAIDGCVGAGLSHRISFLHGCQGPSVVHNGRPRTPEVVVDETWFSDPELCNQHKLWYLLSKTLAEDAAWKFVKEKGIDTVAINPAMVIGPLLQPTLNSSSAEILNLINGRRSLFYVCQCSFFEHQIIFLLN